MKRYSIHLIAILMLAVGLSTAPASARPKSDCVGPTFLLMLGVGY
jgi:hypothetical protein